jgi:hypothetical protein
MTNDSAAPERAARDQPVRRLKKQRDFRGHLVAYLLVNTFLVVIWAATSHGFFWPGIIMAGWGIALAMNAWGRVRPAGSLRGGHPARNAAP